VEKKNPLPKVVDMGVNMVVENLEVIVEQQKNIKRKLHNGIFTTASSHPHHPFFETTRQKKKGS
jgi:hypothetical protein